MRSTLGVVVGLSRVTDYALFKLGWGSRTLADTY